MDGTQDDTKPLTRRLIGSKRTLAILLCFVVLVGTSAAAVPGGEEWVYSGHTDTVRGIASDDSGNFYTASDDGSIHKIDNSGAQVWSQGGYTDVHDVAVRPSDGKSFIISQNNDSVIGLTTGGGVDWTDTINDQPLSIAYSSTNDTVTVGDALGKFWTFDADTGSVVRTWTQAGDSDIRDMDIGPDGYIYAALQQPDEGVYKYHPNGTEMWNYTQFNNIPRAVTVAPNGEYAIGSGTNQDPTPKGDVHNISSDGTKNWDILLGDVGGVYRADIDDNGTIYVPYEEESGNYNLSAISSDGQTFIWNYTGATGNIEDVVLDNDQNLIGAATSAGNVRAVGSSFTPTYEISGTVTHAGNGTAIDGVSISVNNTTTATVNGTDTTDTFGIYNVTGLANGTYNVTATKAGYSSNSTIINLQNSDQVVDLELRAVNETLRLKVDRRHLEHNQKTGYTVTYLNYTNGTVERTDVTQDATVTSNNTSILTVLSASQELKATNDTSVNDVALVSAQYSGATATETVTVANLTVDHIDILPPWARFEATISPGTEANPNDHSFMLIMIATMVAVAGTLIMSVFVGLGGFTMIIIAGWLIGLTTTGLMLVVLTVVGFAGLNMAANIDYAVT